MRALLPLLPAWVLGLWLLFTSGQLWDAEGTGRNLQGESMAAGWFLLIALVVGTVLFVGAPFFGHKLAVPSVSSATVGLGDSNAAQRAFGAGFVRCGVLVGLYLLVGALTLGYA